MQKTPPKLLNYSKELRRTSPHPEQVLWAHLRDRRLLNHKFRRQYVIAGYIVDFVCLEKKLIIEADGGQHMENKIYDDARTLMLESRGYRVIRFWNNEVLTQLHDCLEVIVRELEC